MEFRTLGSTGMRVSEVGFGCGDNAGLMVRGSASERDRVVGRALDLGINFFDTAAMYGSNTSEINLGETLHALNAKPLISSKLWLVAPDLDDIPAAVEKAIDASLRRLQVDHLDLIELHNSVVEQRVLEPGSFPLGPKLSAEDVLGPGGVVEGFEKARSAGKVRFFQTFTRRKEFIESGRFHSIMEGYNLINPTAGRLPPPGFSQADHGQTIDQAAANGLGVVVIRALAMGAASGQKERPTINTPPTQTPGMEAEYQENQRRSRALGFLIRDDQSLAQAAIKFALMKKEVSTVLLGFATEEHVIEAASCSGSPGLTDAELQKLEALYQSDFGGS